MKKLLTITGLLISTLLFSQAPQSINYQAVIRDAQGLIFPNQTVSLKLEISSSAGNYTEVRNVVTNNLGLVNLAVGLFPASGSIDFKDIVWGGNSLTTYLDPTGGATNWQTIGSVDLHSVPFALVAEKATFADSVSFMSIANQISFVLNGDSLIIPGIDTLVIPFSQYSITEAQVDSMVANNGYLLVEGDSSTTNEIQFISRSNDTIFLTNGGFVVLPTDLDGDPTNEIQDLTITANILTITGKTNPNAIDLSGYLDNTVLTEAQVDAYANNNGYLTTEVDGSITNEIQDLSITANILTITGKTNPTNIDLSGYLDNTVLSEAQVDAFANNNGYLMAEVDGSVTNEIQNLDSVLSTGNDANGTGIIDLGNVYIGTNTGASSAALDVTSTTQGFLPPRMTQVQRDAISNPTEGLIIWCTDCGTNGLLSGYGGTGWANLQLSNPSGTVPTVTTDPVSSYGFSSATFSGNVLDTGGASILARGICYSTSPNPNISNNTTQISSGSGTFSDFVIGLDTGTTYYLRAYATNSNGTGYGNQVSFTTNTVHSIGDFYQGGTIAYILQPGDQDYVLGEQHGLIVLPWDYYNNNMSWLGSSSCNAPSGTSPFIGDGDYNTNLAYNACSTATTGVIQVAYNMSVNGYNDWYVPSSEELKKILLYASQFGMLGKPYWSSTRHPTYPTQIYCWFRVNSTISSQVANPVNLTSNTYLRVIRYF